MSDGPDGDRLTVERAPRRPAEVRAMARPSAESLAEVLAEAARRREAMSGQPVRPEPARSWRGRLPSLAAQALVVAALLAVALWPTLSGTGATSSTGDRPQRTVYQPATSPSGAGWDPWTDPMSVPFAP